jgi:hypothetical protein
MADWDADSPQLQQNLSAVLRDLRDDARQRKMPSVEMARIWQERVMGGLDLPDPAYLDRFRGETGLENCEVRIGAKFGVEPYAVAAELSEFERKLQLAMAELDSSIPTAAASIDELAAILEVCAWAHAEWVRIHPFANGNGRTARLWANFIAMRYGLPPFVTLRPRPGDGYGLASAAAMDGDWRPTERAFRVLLRDALKR